jgi:hypothetical protein
MKRILAGVGALLTLTLSLGYGTPAFADLKAVQTAICDAYTNTIVKADGPVATCPGTSCGAPCTDFMVFMDQAGWHVIHDMRTGGAWWQGSSTGACPAGDACYVLIFLKN